MSTPRLPSYAESPESFGRTPSYSAEPGLYEQRLALNARSFPRPIGNFIKTSKHEDVKLRLAAQDKLELPMYNIGASVEGAVEVTKADSISSVELKVTSFLIQLSSCPHTSCRRWKGILN
jgi:hypothetical protein